MGPPPTDCRQYLFSAPRAHDARKSLGCGKTLTRLRRTKIRGSTPSPARAQSCPGKFEDQLCRQIPSLNTRSNTLSPRWPGEGEGEGADDTQFAAPPTSPSRCAGPSLCPQGRRERLIVTSSN